MRKIDLLSAVLEHDISLVKDDRFLTFTTEIIGEHYHDVPDSARKKFIKNFLSQVRDRYKKVRHSVDKFLDKNEEWLKGEIKFPSETTSPASTQPTQGIYHIAKPLVNIGID